MNDSGLPTDSRAGFVSGLSMQRGVIGRPYTSAG